jgi:hypothetical protein
VTAALEVKAGLELTSSDRLETAADIEVFAA